MLHSLFAEIDPLRSVQYLAQGIVPTLRASRWPSQGGSTRHLTMKVSVHTVNKLGLVAGYSAYLARGAGDYFGHVYSVFQVLALYGSDFGCV
jgi:hypothetical protein